MLKDCVSSVVSRLVWESTWGNHADFLAKLPAGLRKPHHVKPDPLPSRFKWIEDGYRELHERANQDSRVLRLIQIADMYALARSYGHSPRKAVPMWIEIDRAYIEAMKTPTSFAFDFSPPPALPGGGEGRGSREQAGSRVGVAPRHKPQPKRNPNNVGHRQRIHD